MEYNALMLSAPLPVYRRAPSKAQREKEAKKRAEATAARDAAAAASSKSRRPFRHSRTSSGSLTSQETSNSSSQADPPTTSAGDQRQPSSHHPQDQQDDLQHQYHRYTSPRSPTAGRHSSKATGSASLRPFPGQFSASSSRTLGDFRSYTSHDSERKNVAMSPDHSGAPKHINASFPRVDSSSASATTSLSARTVPSSEPSAGDDFPSKPFAFRNGRLYLNDPTLSYPLPFDLTELHRQALQTLLLIQLHGAPVCSPSLTTKPPQRVLEVGCGAGFWSMMCHRYFKSRGHSGISFTGIDIAPLAPGSANIPSDAFKPDRDMKWKFVHHDLRHLPWPVPSEEYDLVIVKDMSLATTHTQRPLQVDEYLRVLRPGGTLEMWESDHSIRMLRPHIPNAVASGESSEEYEAVSSIGAYVMNANTPLSAPLNPFLVEYNQWLTRALEARDLSGVPCTLIGPGLLQESELIEVRSRRLAIPFSEVRWEREGVGGVVTKDGKSYVDMKAKGAPHQKVEKKTLTAGQAALRNTALLTVVQQVQALEPLLREASGKSQDEWDVWLGKMMNDLMNEGGSSWGECLEVGAWWGKKKKTRT